MMLAKRFFYVSMGILALMVAYHLGAVKATASFSSGQIVGLWGYHAHTEAGDAWALYPSTWSRDPAYDLPVPVSDVKFIGGDRDGGAWLVTRSDEGWVRYDAGWQSLGSFPGGPTSVPPMSPVSWGEVKGQFADD